VSGKSVCDSGQTLTKLSVIVKIQTETTDGSNALGDLSSADAFRQAKRVHRRFVER
jgi:hypothetical protein